MYVSGTLHLYSGSRNELFFVFDDDVAQQLYKEPSFDPDDVESRSVYISVGTQRFISRRTMSFSRKQTEIKVSLCSQGSKEGLGNLTSLYDWYTTSGGSRPAPFEVIGSLKNVIHRAETVWELRISEPADSVVPPGLRRRQKKAPPERRSYENRRLILARDLAGIGRVAEQMALTLAQDDYSTPTYLCLWRDTFLDSERVEIRQQGIIADIDIWNVQEDHPELYIEVKAQKVSRSGTVAAFHLSNAEWRSHGDAKRAGTHYQIWLFQYLHINDFVAAPQHVNLIVFSDLKREWLQPDGYFVLPEVAAGIHYPLTMRPT